MFSEQTTAARRDYFASSNSGVVGQDVRDVGDVVEKFKGGIGAAVVMEQPRPFDVAVAEAAVVRG